MRLGLILLLAAALVACAANEDTSPDAGATVIVLPPTQIAANLYAPPSSPATLAPTREPIRMSAANRAALADAPSPETPANSTVAEPSPEIPPSVAEALPAEPPANSAELQAMTDNPSIMAAVEMVESCFVADDFVSFTLKITSLETAPIWFYKQGRWLFSLNGTPLGPDIASRLPTARDEFVQLEPNGVYTQEEEDLGLWVQSLGPEYFSLASPTGIGLPAGTYWLTFMYNNDQAGQERQVGGTYLIDKPAWQGTIVAPQVGFRVVNDLSEC